MCISDGVCGSILKMIEPAGSDGVDTQGRADSSRSRFRLRLPPQPGVPAFDVVLETHVFSILNYKEHQHNMRKSI